MKSACRYLNQKGVTFSNFLCDHNVKNNKSHMKKIFIKSLLVIFAITLFASCKKEAEKTKLIVITFPQTFTASNNVAVLATTNDSVSAITFTWTSVSYGIKAPVTYTLQFDVPSDTIGTSPWSKATEYVVGDDLLNKNILGVDLNKIAVTGLGLPTGSSSRILVRVKSFVDRPAYSNVLILDIKPHIIFSGYPSLWVPGDYQGWDPTAAPTIVSVNSNLIYDGFIYIPAGAGLNFKFINAMDWNHIIYGDAGNGSFSTNGLGAALSVPTDGYYEFIANLNTLKWTATKTTWSILGDATPGGWSTDTQLTYDVTNKVWTVTANMVSNGSFKFRANNAWAIDFGIDAAGKLAYADNPILGNNPAISNITVPSSGNYTITLDLHTAGSYTYKLIKN
jgi:hypothetical protein